MTDSQKTNQQLTCTEKMDFLDDGGDVYNSLALDLFIDLFYIYSFIHLGTQIKTYF